MHDLTGDLVRRRFPQWPANAALRGGYLNDISGFDARFFNLSLREARLMDPQQRLFLEVAWEALESAAYAPRGTNLLRTGVFVGASTMDYVKLVTRLEDRRDPHARTGTALSMLANRVSYLLDLEGPSLTVDTACSSSLVAVHLACQCLRVGEANQAIAGGVNLNLNPEGQRILEQESVLARDGRCKAFDHRADGFGRGEGAAAVVLKPLAAALRDRDFIWGIIRGTATNNDGHSKANLSAPNPKAQCDVILAALRDARLSANSIGYVEAHGTGTALGDPIEVEALVNAFAQSDSRKGFCGLGTAKTNLGHLEAAAGIAGLLRAVMALKHQAIPPTLHFLYARMRSLPLSKRHFTSTIEVGRGKELVRRAALGLAPSASVERMAMSLLKSRPASLRSLIRLSGPAIC